MRSRWQRFDWMAVWVSLQAAGAALAAPFVAAASAPAPSAAQILAAFTDAIPEVEAPSATVKVTNFTHLLSNPLTDPFTLNK